jgi:hypothetical protein
VKGRNMVAHFQEGRMRRVNVNGNGESIYFALDGDTVMTGMNKAVCSNMVLNFAENKLKSISFHVEPEASFIPPHELKPTDRRLEGFAWLDELRPGKRDVLASRMPVAVQAPQPAAGSGAKGKKAPAKNKKAPAKPTQQMPARK